MCILWYMFWLLFVYEKPGHHPFITDEELEYIQEAQGKDTIDYEVNIEKVPRGIQCEKSSKDTASSGNMVSTIGA